MGSQYSINAEALMRVCVGHPGVLWRELRVGASPVVGIGRLQFSMVAGEPCLLLSCGNHGWRFTARILVRNVLVRVVDGVLWCHAPWLTRLVSAGWPATPPQPDVRIFGCGCVP